MMIVDHHSQVPQCNWLKAEYMMMSKNLDDDDTLLLLVEILEEVEEFFLNSFFVDILVDKLQWYAKYVSVCEIHH